MYISVFRRISWRGIAWSQRLSILSPRVILQRDSIVYNVIGSASSESFHASWKPSECSSIVYHRKNIYIYVSFILFNFFLFSNKLIHSYKSIGRYLEKELFYFRSCTEVSFIHFSTRMECSNIQDIN